MRIAFPTVPTVLSIDESLSKSAPKENPGEIGKDFPGALQVTGTKIPGIFVIFVKRNENSSGI